MSDQPKHSPIGASSYSRWGASLGGCPGSVRLAAQFPKTTSSYAEAGTKAHELAYAMLMGQPFVPLENAEEQEAVEIYVKYVWAQGDPNDKAVLWRGVEQAFDLSHYFPNLRGTADTVIYWYRTKKLKVIDYKHGAGVPVEVEENSQLMYYGLGALTALGLPVDQIELVIVQPRCHHKDGPIRVWKTDAVRMLEFVADLIEDAKMTEDPRAPLNPGDHCRWCPAQANCPALQEKSLALAKNVFSPVSVYKPDTLADTLAMLPAMESWIKAVREFAYREAEHGRCPPGWKLVEKRAMRKWKPEVTIDYICQSLSLKTQDAMDYKLKSPAQLEKMLQTQLADRMRIVKAQKTLAGQRSEEEQQQRIWNDFNYCVVKESSGYTLVTDADTRPATKKIEDVFGRVSTEAEELI